CRLLCRDRCFGSRSDNDIRLEPDKLGRDLGIALGAPLAPTVLDCDGAALDPAEFAQPPNKCVNPRALACSRPPAEPADHRHPGLLRPRRERPHSHRAAEQSDEVAALHCQPLPCFDGKIAHLVRQETAALRDFYPAYDRCGSVAPDGYAKCGRGMSAPRRKRTSRQTSR